MDAVLLFGQAFVYFQKGDDAFNVPKVVSGRLSCDLSIHRTLEQDCAQNPIAVEARTSDNPRAHLMHEGKHLLLIRPRLLLDPVIRKRLRGAAAALVECRKEAGLG